MPDCGGLELEYNEELTGQNGEILTAKNAWGYDMPTHYQTVVDAVPGNTLTLTIDANIQHWLESAMDAAVREHNVAQRGVGIVMDVQTGAILAMTSQPDYDPNTPRQIINEEVRAEVDALTGEARSAALQEAQQAQWRNKAISDLYEPGSVFKLITAAGRFGYRCVHAGRHLCLRRQDQCGGHLVPLCQRAYPRCGDLCPGTGSQLQPLFYPDRCPPGQGKLL